jgi:hypothetical protein
MRFTISAVLLLCAVAVAAQDMPRVFVLESTSWEMKGAAGGNSEGFGAASKGGARPQTAEIIKTFTERCPQVNVTMKQERANYSVRLDHEGGKDLIGRDNKIVVFDQDGDLVMSKSTRVLGNAVKDACAGIAQHWARTGRARAAELAGGSSAAAVKPATLRESGNGAASSASAKAAHLDISSEPDGAEITIDGNFVGSTPSSITLEPGHYMVQVRKKGYTEWVRKIRITGGTIAVVAELERK